ncbi:hypothetical protein AB0M80_34015 [Amycolatopsis sp. NPDC051045]|uniref:hypothetical protein n=1 Tax=Amycolatopsis sp. NPDC051045 TaxID=3156922 RepID=UPI003437558A
MTLSAQWKLTSSDIEGEFVRTFTTALEAAFGTGTAAMPELKVDQFDGRPVSVPTSATCYCNADEWAHAKACVTRLAEAVEGDRTCYCRVELPEPVAAIAG